MGPGRVAALVLAGCLVLTDVYAADAYPGQFAIRTKKGFYVTAISGGGRSTEPTVITAATTAGPWEKFRIAVLNPPPPNDKSFQTANGNYLTAVNGGGMTSDVLHTDATQPRAWEQFRVFDLSLDGSDPTWFVVATSGGKYLTAVGEGGKYADAFHSDATQIGSWEKLRIVKCGELGTGYQYTIVPANDQILTAVSGGGLDKGDTIVQGGYFGYLPEWSRFTFVQQIDGSYALQTSDGAHFVTALGGGGQVQKYIHCHPGFPGACIDGTSTIFHTDATRIGSWERFRFVDVGSCKYTIKTTSGFFVGIYQDSEGHTLLTTRRSIISDNEKFQLILNGLASPVVIH